MNPFINGIDQVSSLQPNFGENHTLRFCCKSKLPRWKSPQFIQVQYRSKVSWQSRLETQFSILEVFENRESRIEFRESSFEDWESSFKDRVSSEFFYNPKRVCCFDLRNFNRPPKRKQTLTAKEKFYLTKCAWHTRILTCGRQCYRFRPKWFSSAWVLIFLSALPHAMVSHVRGRAMRIVFS